MKSLVGLVRSGGHGPSIEKKEFFLAGCWINVKLTQRQWSVWSDDECSQLVSTFTDEVDRIDDDIADCKALRSSTRCVFALRWYHTFQPVGHWRRSTLVDYMPPVIPARRSAVLVPEVIAPMTARQACQSLTPATTERCWRRWDWIVDTSSDRIFKPDNHVQDSRESRVGTSTSAPATWSQFQSAYRKRHATETALLRVVDDVDAAADNWQRGDRLRRSVCSLRHSQRRDLAGPTSL